MEKQPVQKKDMHVLFLGMQETMISKLEWARKNIPHSGEKGAAAEVEWIAWLREFLPKRYSVDKGFVIAHDGTLSDQIDIIIYDRVFSPLAFICEDVKYIPVESVYAVIEVKQELKGNCQYAGEKAASVRRLPRKVIPQVRVGGKLTDTNPPVEILAGIIATSYGWKTEPLGNTLEVNLRSVAENPLNRINFGCDLQDGAFWVEYEPEFRLEKSAKEETLLFLFLKLFLKLQSNGTIPPTDLMAYASVLDSFQNTEAAQGMTEQ